MVARIQQVSIIVAEGENPERYKAVEFFKTASNYWCFSIIIFAIVTMKFLMMKLLSKGQGINENDFWKTSD